MKSLAAQMMVKKRTPCKRALAVVKIRACEWPVKEKTHLIVYRLQPGKSFFRLNFFH